MEYECNMQDRLDQVSSWCDNNHVVISLVKTMSMTVTTRQKHFVVAYKMSIDCFWSLLQRRELVNFYGV